MCTEFEGNASLHYKTADEVNMSYYRQDFFWSNGVIMTIVVIFGIFGNLATCAIVRQRFVRSRINPYILALAIWDTLVLISGGLLYGWSALRYGSLPWYGSHVYKYIICHPVCNIARTASVWTLLATSIERFLAVKDPLRHQLSCSPGRTRSVLVIIGIVAIMFGLPKFAEIEVIDCRFHDKQVAALQSTSIRNSHLYYIIYMVCLDLIFISLVPIAIQAVLTCQIYHSLRESSIRRRQIANTNNGAKSGSYLLESAMTKMFVMVCVKFLICLILPTIVNLLELGLRLAGRGNLVDGVGIFGLLVDLSNLLVITNSALNFPIYMIFGEKFRQAFITSFFCRDDGGDHRHAHHNHTRDLETHCGAGDRRRITTLQPPDAGQPRRYSLPIYNFAAKAKYKRKGNKL